MLAVDQIQRVYRLTGADLPFGDPVPSHGTEMEGWFWRISDAASGRVVVALCSANRHPDGDWSTAAVAVHPGGHVRAAALDHVEASRSEFDVRARGDAGTVDVSREHASFALDDATFEADFHDSYAWPKIFGGGGVFSSVPFLNQYWHPYRLGGRATGSVRVGKEQWNFQDATVYCERNWGAGFPERWWWGQAHDFDGADVSVAFSGGKLSLGPVSRDVTGVVVRMGDDVIRITPPAPVRSVCGLDGWRVQARNLRYQVDLDGAGSGTDPHVLPVPLPARKANIDTDFEHLAGTLRCTIRDFGRVVFDETSQLAGLEVGSRPPP